MLSDNLIYIILGIAGGLFLFVIIVYLAIKKASNKGDAKRIKQLREGTKEKSFSMDVFYQKVYIYARQIPFLKRYVRKLRRKLEIINIDNEYLTRRQTAQILIKAMVIFLILTMAIVILTKDDPLLLTILLFFEIFLIETIMSGTVDKQDTKLLKQQIDFFAEIRHAYHEFNMVEEAIYEVSQKDELEVSRQGQKIYEILISDDPETELEKYYDVAPNSYLKEFAGISYLTREFGDRTIDGASLYLKNLNNITEEMQLEILKRDRLDYVFQSLSFIAMVPVLFLQPLKNWAISNFSFTAQFYNRRAGLIVQILLIIVTLICYILTRKLKDSGAIKEEYKDPEKTWQMKLYKNPIIKKITNSFIPKPRTKENRKIVNLLKEAASKQKIETLFINRICLFIVVFLLSLVFMLYLHSYSVQYIYTEPTSDYDILGEMSDADKASGMEITEQDNYFLKKFKGNTKITEQKIAETLEGSKYYQGATSTEIETASGRIYGKLQIINAEYLKWFELLLAFVFGIIGYNIPKLMLTFQKIIRKLEIENEIMQFQTIILMLMKIERVSAEIILEWLERYSNIFREPITKCVNNYESGAWEALEVLKNDIAAPQLIRIVESLQAAVEKIPIAEAFDELDNEREYYKAKRKESNEKLIARKGMIGKVIGFTPLVGLFVGYLIVPLVLIGMTSMTSSFSTISTVM